MPPINLNKNVLSLCVDVAVCLAINILLKVSFWKWIHWSVNSFEVCRHNISLLHFWKIFDIWEKNMYCMTDTKFPWKHSWVIINKETFHVGWNIISLFIRVIYIFLTLWCTFWISRTSFNTFLLFVSGLVIYTSRRLGND